MTTVQSQLVPIDITPGVQPSTDATSFKTPHFTMSDKVRFRFGKPRKIGGWISIAFDGSATILGKIRTIFGSIISNRIITTIGTHKKLYSYEGARLTNITPLQTTTVAIANSMATDYGMLTSNPITTVSGSNILIIADANASKYQSGDTITLSGATTVAGIDATTYLNAAHVLHTVGASSYTVIVGVSANASISGGGASVVRKTGRITVTAASHGQSNGDRTKITGAATFGGIADTFINAEFIIRNVAAGTFDIFTGGTATSSASAGGGASTKYQVEIPAGYENQSLGQGYGAGMYGVGLYGTALISSDGINYPRNWSVDKYGDNFIMTPGGQTGVYEWNGSTMVAPALVANAPTAVNYAFISNNILVTFGAGGVKNKIFASDQGNITQWTASSSNQVFEYNVYGAGGLLCQLPVNGVNLFFTEDQTYTLTYIGLPLVWGISKLDGSIGIIAPKAGCVVNGVAYWMGMGNFYCWKGGNIEIVGANTQLQSTILNYVFSDITTSQTHKIFCWYNKEFDEICWHYPSSSANEPDRVARFNVSDKTWCPDTIDRTAAESPILLLGYPRLASSASVMYRHEFGTDADGVAMPWSLTSNSRYSGKNNAMLTGFVPDSIQTGNINLNVVTRLFPQSSVAISSDNYVVGSTTERVTIQNMGRFWQYTWSGNALGVDWQMGMWLEYLKASSPQ